MRRQPIVHADVVRLIGGPMDGSLRWDRTKGKARFDLTREAFIISLPVDHPKAKDYYAVSYNRQTGRVAGWLRRPRPARKITLG